VDVPWRAACGELGRFERVRLAGSGRERVWRPRDARFLSRQRSRGARTPNGKNRAVGWLVHRPRETTRPV